MLATKFNLISLISTALLLVTFSGCSNANPLIIGKETVRIDKQKSVQEGKFLKVMFEFVNEDNDNVEGMVYQVEWMDAKGFVKDSTAWKPLTIIGKQRIQVVEMTNLPDIADYRIQISTPNK